MLLRKFSYDDHGNKSSTGKVGGGASNNVERWPQPMWQDRGKARKGSNATTGTEAAATKSTSHNRVANDTAEVKAASVPRSAHLQRLSPDDAEYGRVLKLAARYLNPTHLVFALGAGSLVEVESVDKIVCPAARNEFDQLSSALGVTSATSASVVVSKFLQCYDRAAVSKKAVVGADAWLSGPAGPALYFGNVFAVEGGARSPDGSKGQTAAPPAEGEVLLCDVAAGRMCLNPSNSLVDDLHQAAELGGSTAPTSESSPSSGSLAAMSALSSKGFDSITTTVGGTPHLTVFDGARVLPTHLVRFRQRTSPQCSAPRGGASTEAGGASKAPGAAMKAVDGGNSSPDSTPQKQVAGHGASPSSPEVAAARAVQSLARTQADREATVAGARRTAQRLRQQFRDLEEALHAKRDYLLALVRREEEGALAALHKQERGLQQQLGGAGALRPATAAADGQELANRGRFSPGLASQSSPSKSNGDNNSAEAGTDPFDSVVLDTGRMMALIEHLSLEGLSLTEGAAAISSEGSGSTGVASRPGSNMGSRRPGSSSAASLFPQKSEFQPANRGARDDHRPPSSSSSNRPSGASRRQSLPTTKAEPLIEPDPLARTSGDASNSVVDASSSSSARLQGTAKATTSSNARARPAGVAVQEASSSSSGSQSRRSTKQPVSRNSAVPEPLAITRPMTSPGPGQTPGAGVGRLGGVGGAGVRVAPKLGMVRAPARLPQSNGSGAQRPPTGSKGAPRTQQR